MQSLVPRRINPSHIHNILVPFSEVRHACGDAFGADVNPHASLTAPAKQVA